MRGTHTVTPAGPRRYPQCGGEALPAVPWRILARAGPMLVALLNKHRIACANLNQVADLERHPQLRNYC